MGRIAALRNDAHKNLRRNPITGSSASEFRGIRLLRSSVDEVLIREILGSPGRSESQLLVSDSCNKRSIRGVAKGKKCLCPTRIGLGTGPRGGDCYSELRRILLLRRSVNKGQEGQNP
jgi:hypothetical protein